jgi:hypothetical protein
LYSVLEVFSTKRGIVWSGASVVGNTVNDVLIGGSDLNTNVANTASVTSTSNGSLGLLATLNSEQRKNMITKK